MQPSAIAEWIRTAAAKLHAHTDDAPADLPLRDNTDHKSE
jgi:hypothetical protein